MNQWYALHDYHPEMKRRGAIFIHNKKEAQKLNQKGFGIFWAVNTFKDNKRTEENLETIEAFFVDIDKGTKDEQRKAIRSNPDPSFIVETKNGHHVYWLLDNPPPLDEYKDFMRTQIVPKFNGDIKAADATRILRIPGFNHMKDPRNPFMVKCLKDNWRRFDYKELQLIFQGKKRTAEPQKRIITNKNVSDAANFWERCHKLSCLDALTRLSGTEHVSGEIFTFVPYREGHQIHVNGKSTSCWIDGNDRIGSSDKGGPSIVRWLFWYHKDWARVAKILKETYPDLVDDGQ